MVPDCLARSRKGTIGAVAGVSRFLLFGGLVTLFWSLAISCKVSAQVPPSDVTFSRYADFRIPFQPETGERRLKQVQLFVSTDQGQTWHQVTAVEPERRYFDFRAPHDGLYWFATRTVDLEGRQFPATMEGARPGLKVQVDMQPPLIRLRQAPPRDGEIAVEWDVRDENLDPNSLRLDYHSPGSAEWIGLGGDLQASGQRSWKAPSSSIEVRLRASDRAGNAGEDKITVTPGVYAPANQTNPTFAGAGTTQRSLENKVQYVNSTRIALNYEIKEKGPSGVSAIQLWYTQDLGGRSWVKWDREDSEVKPPFIAEVNGEGLYGFTLLVKSGVGLSDKPPQAGDLPQVWVEVDTTKPVVHLGTVEVGRGPESGRLAINYTATDKNLDKQPISLFYAEQTGGAWTSIAARVDNTGRYIWQMPTAVPYKFLVKVEAVDKAGNIGSAETEKAVIVDLVQPKGVILTVEPAGQK